jgi:uncharacterized protein (DUF4415 family)
MPTSKRSGAIKSAVKSKRVKSLKSKRVKSLKSKRVKSLAKRSVAPPMGFMVLGQHLAAKPRPDRQIDADDAPELTEEFFERADVYHGNKLVPAGRPRSENPKMALKLRIDPDVVEHFRATGPGWQTRINDTLRKAAKLPAKHSRSR